VTTLRWGVKQSFCSYVRATGGVIDVSDGAALHDDGAFAFAASAGDLVLDAEGRLSGAASFAGAVTFQTHGGALSVHLADPAIEISGASGVLTVADGPDRARRVAIAQLDVSGLARETSALTIPTKLSIDGIQVLGDHYPASTPLDPVQLILAGA